MGERGPAPAREAERRRTNEPAHAIIKMGRAELAKLPFPVDLSPVAPDPRDFMPDEEEPDPLAINDHGPTRRGTILVRDQNGWHPYATNLYDQLQRDPSRAWNGPAAMAIDLAMCENLSRLLMPRIAATIPATEHGGAEVIYERIPLSGGEMNALMKWASARGLYENDRLRIGKEITFYADGDVVPGKTFTGDAPVISIQKNRRAALAGNSKPDADVLA